ncbi:polysaccharide deacetylase family protein [Butyrivibrio sp. VCD2006]|uniref:polysaccharide deacetylase family protein n=1 Tax=Butyrivibrio sp. VCD2006 TaxID=1280664 RepID=UPI0003FE1C6F|nr:polysaccharide deacetylase family protein [Butyrivibrio sp. VCD2006]
MATNTEGHRSDEARSRRISFLRKLILVSIAASCLIPTGICIFLVMKNSHTNRMLEKAKSELSWYEEHYGEEALADGETDNPVEWHPKSAEDIAEDVREEEKTESDETPEGEPETDGELTESEPEADGAPTETDEAPPEETSSQETSDEEQGERDDKRRVYITFDDGPSTSTNTILDILDSYGVKATFFVTGKEGEEYESVYRRIAGSGHTLGMHSYSHKYSELYESLDSFSADLHKLQTYLYETTGVWSQYYRFPGGSSNTVSKVEMGKLINYLDLEDITYFDWNVASSDDRGGVNKDIIVANVMTGVPKFNEAIILLHDSADKPATVEALPEIIEQIQAMDDTVIVPITDDTLPVQHISNSQ